MTDRIAEIEKRAQAEAKFLRETPPSHVQVSQFYYDCQDLLQALAAAQERVKELEGQIQYPESDVARAIAAGIREALAARKAME